jgi:SNF family Na+-dependent transporter
MFHSFAGNVWRFPYLCYKNGGGSFLVVYAISFAFAAVPISILEVTVGQYLQRGFPFSIKLDKFY